MFCPKCGSQNADETKFCRGCGADLSNVLAAVATPTTTLTGWSRRTPRAAIGGYDPEENLDTLTLAEKYIALFSRGIRGLLIGIGFLFISGMVYSIPPRDGIFWLFPLMFAFFFLSVSASRFVQARGIKELSKRNEPAALSPGQTEYIKPSRSIYETDDLIARPPSVTEHTTTHLQMDPDGETMTLPEK